MTDIQSTMLERLGPPGWEPHEVASAALNATHADFVQQAVAPIYLLVQARALNPAAINWLVMRTGAHREATPGPMTALVTECEPAGGAQASLPPESGAGLAPTLLATLACEAAVIVPLRRSGTGRPLALGRSSSVDIPVRHTSISKLHALFSYDEQGRLQFRDTGSKNGSFVNGTRLAPHETRAIDSGAELVFGKVGAVAVDASALWCVLDGAAQ